MKTVIRTTIIMLVGLGILAGAGFWGYKSLTATDEQQISKAAEEADDKLEQGENTVAPTSDEDVETVGLSEGEFQVKLHQMTHQKIKATEKRGAIQMTEARIEEMQKILYANKDAYKNYDFYERSLAAWKEGDFSNAVSVHNTIWEWHNGTVGRATGLLSAEEEAAYVESQF
ncbi:DUF6241 domain-containing protein [Planococcus maritimus]|uniref:DUF6241 domain-containing protein n=1 Tax=Planococcus maritimus TaxID=192421 RepID=UPI003139CC29